MSALDLKLVIISGLSGSGKTHALKCFEDLGFFCVDNLPPPLLPVFVDLCVQSHSEIRKMAVGVDIRERDFLKGFHSASDQLKKAGYSPELIFIEARDEVLIRRFSETRRPHPLAKDRPVLEGIQLEKEQLSELRKQADRIIDSSDSNVHQLKGILMQHYVDRSATRKPTISVISFGYKHGIPPEADLMFDVRFLQNPNFVPELNALTGEDSKVAEYVFRKGEAGIFLDHVKALLMFLIPFFEIEGRPYLTVAIGCTGGRHRSVAVACRLYEDLKSAQNEVSVRHRDINRER